MYFDSFPKILYDSKGNGEVKIVTNLLKRVAIRAKVKNIQLPVISARFKFGKIEINIHRRITMFG